MTIPHVLQEYERTQILRQVVAARVSSKAIIETSGGNLDGGFTSRNKGPYVQEWGTTWARVAMGNKWSNPGPASVDMILVGLMASVVTCGFYLPVWFLKTLKRPPWFRIDIDEYGRDSWTKYPIPPKQRILSVVVLILMLWWLGAFLPQLTLFLHQLNGLNGVRG